MSDRYLFKAKRTDNGEWISGDLITTPFIRNETQENIPYILDITKADYECFGDFSEGNGIFEVAPSTVCQSTGLTDKNGKKIWENDIVRRTDLHKTTEPSIGIIQYDTANTAYLVHWVDVVRYSPTYPWKDKIEVIGNIFENPELLEGIRVV